MIRRVPIIPTVIVLAAVLTMIGFGIWQLQRAEWKEGLLARYRQAQALSSDVPWPKDDSALRAAFFRHSNLICFNPGADAPIAGRSADGEAGWAHLFSCDLAPGGQGGKANVIMGWSKDPAPRIFRGGRLRGFIASSGSLVVDPDLVLPGLRPSAHPDPNDLPNNHLSYAFQWFFFALTALVIYVLALRKRWRA
jgi:surfeit locus 1 family protein